MRNSGSSRVAARLGAGALLLTLLAAPAVAELPLGALKNWSALSLEDGMLLHKETGSHGSVYFVYVHQQIDNAGSDLRFLAYQGGDDADGAVASLIARHRLRDADVKALGAYAPGHQTTQSAGIWTALTFGEAYDIADDAKLGGLGTRMEAYLLTLEALLYPAKAVSDELYIAQATLCDFTNALRSEMIVVGNAVQSTESLGETVKSSATISGATAATSTSTETYLLTAGRYCAGVWPPPPGTTPAFPITPGFTPPTGPIKWSGTGCGADEVGDQEDCISSADGDLCTCECTPIGLGFSWKPVAGTCAAIPVTPGPGAPGGPNACTPNGGQGPCSNAGGDTCVCTCVTNGAPPPADVWGAPIDCGSETLAVFFLLAVFGGSWWARRRIA